MLLLQSNQNTMQSLKLYNTVTFQMLHHAITFDEKLQNWPTLVISYKVFKGGGGHYKFSD